MKPRKVSQNVQMTVSQNGGNRKFNFNSRLDEMEGKHPCRIRPEDRWVTKRAIQK